jgi:23S rRNA (cytosine1962-C5)-methyltransferase
MAKAFLARGKESRTEDRHPWIYRSDIDRVDGIFKPGDVVDIYSSKNKFLGRGYFNPKSQISIRMLTHEHEEVNRDFLYKRLLSAWEYRKRVADVNSCRVVFSESDFIPGLVVDKFANTLVLQTSALGIERYKSDIVDILNDIIKPDGIYERNDIHVRELEGLEQQKGFLSKEFNTKIEMIENGVTFLVDVENGQKTGYFLDQKENRAALRPFVKNAKVLDCFCHTGPFALHAAHYGAREVVGIDISEHASEYATNNAKLNKLDATCRFETANTFDRLREYDDKSEKFEVVILDPPAFTKSKSAIEGAIRGYKEINLRAMKIIERGGFLVTCSCSHHIDNEMFLDIVYNAAIDSQKDVRLIEYRSQAKDHPILISAQETEYLKCAILQVM